MNSSEKAKSQEKSTCLLTNFASTSSRQSTFSLDLCTAFIKAGIPFWKLENQFLRSFLEKYTNQTIPNESTLRKNYVDVIYNSTMQKITKDVGDNNIWISIDETYDTMGRFVANVVIGILDIEAPKQFLIACKKLEKTNSSTIAQLFTSSLSLLWSQGVPHEKVLLFVTDAAPYMKKAATALKVIFPKMLHITCLAHSLHRISEYIRGLFPNVDKLVSNGKKIFLKAPSRCHLLKEIAPDLSLPPQPVVTRWGSWISAVLYYASNFDMYNEVISSFDPNEASSIRIVKDLMKDNSVRNELAYINTYFAKIPDNIAALETRNQLLVDALKLYESVIFYIMQAPGEKGKLVHEKCNKVVQANLDLNKLKNIASVLEGKTNIDIVDMSPMTISCHKYAPVTSVEVERSFSMYKHILSDRRQSLKFENLEKLLVVMCNSD